jgi:hypothetical protein
MKLVDLEWQINKILRETTLSLDERLVVQEKINGAIEKFGETLITMLTVKLERKI